MECRGKNPAKILVVEDEANVAQVMRARLESYGYHVCGVVTSGQDAIEAAQRLNPDIILMDIKIEGSMDGIESARQIHSRIEVPIIFLSSYTDETLLERARSAEPFGYIIKPYEGPQLFVSVEMALYKHRMEQERRKLVSELKGALSRVKKLSGPLPICSSCKKIRDDNGYWNRVETYIQKHSDTEFTHGICPECAQKLYPDFFKMPEG